MTSATIIRADLKHGRTEERMRFRAIIEDRDDRGFSIAYSHAPKPTKNGGVWYSDSLTSANTFEDALLHVDTICGILEKAHEVRPWHD